MEGGPFSMILGPDFLRKTKMVLDVASKKYSFGFAPNCSGEFCCWEEKRDGEGYLQNLTAKVSQVATNKECWLSGVSSASILAEFSALFSSALGTANSTPYEIELSDTAPVHASLYRCAPPIRAVFKAMVNDLLEQGVVRPRKSPYASQAF